jgi:hypothetical protein
MDHAAHDYRLRRGSPCIAAGIDPGFLPTTFDGQSMLKPYDIGAYDSKNKTPAPAS